MVHRIDKNTSGLMVIGKTEKAVASLAKQFFDHTINRVYHALVWGDITEDNGTIVAHVGRNQRQRKLFDAYPEGEHGKEAITHYTVLERFGYVTLVECRLETVARTRYAYICSISGIPYSTMIHMVVIVL
jgi:23S rRNA pseudouridine1911/1915/1917 synthase